MKTILTRIGRPIRRRLSLKVLIGGPLGAFAWSLSGAGVIAVLIWGIQTITIPLLIIKTTAWWLWGVGFLRQFNLRKHVMVAAERARTNGDRNTQGGS